VRIGLDMLSIQAAGTRDRGIAAYLRPLVGALLGLDSGHDFILYGHDEYPRAAIPTGPRSRLLVPDFGRPAGESERTLTPGERLERLTQANPEGLDWLLVLDPFEPALGLGPPAGPLPAPTPRGGLRIAAVVADLTPFVLPERDLRDPALAERGYRALERLRHYDAILTPSAVTRGDALALLGLPPGRVCAIGNAADGSSFAPEESIPMPLAARRVLHDLGVRRAFLLVDAGYPGQKNVERTIAAYRLLPDRLRLGYQLVFVGAVPDGVIAQMCVSSADPSAMVFAGAVPEAVLRTLFQHCTVSVHPALHAGFGQPILEAMLCGAAVVAGDNSVHAELVGDAGLLADPSDPVALGARIGQVIDDWTLARTLRSRAVAHAARFPFAHAAANTLAVLERATHPGPGTRLRGDPPHRRPHHVRPRIAFFSPLPPRISGIADYAVRLLAELKATYTIDLYHDAGYLPDLGLSGREFATHDARLFERHDAVLNYHAIVYQMGNSLTYHGFIYDALLRHPGVVTLHDFFLSVYPYRGTRGGAEVLAAFRRAIRHFCPDRADAFVPHLEAWCEEEGGLAAACARRGLYLNRGVFESALGVVVHSPWCLEQVRAWMPEQVAKTVVIPLAVEPRPHTTAGRDASRDRLALPRDALVVSSVGFIHPDKLVAEALEAFQPIAAADPSAWFLAIGDECDGGAARRRAEALGLADRVRFLGRRPAAEYADVIAASDVGINLRRPPTNGETSAALLDLLAGGVPTIVTDVATFADYPDTVVCKVRWDDQGPAALARALAALAGDRGARARLGQAARAHVRERHSWPRAAASYVELIERCAATRRRAAAIPIPHRPRNAVPAEEVS
jgi:glycosyltransferase involved in cell wall biosynthesis